MSTTQPTRHALAATVPERWKRFLRSGEPHGTRGSVRAGATEAPLDLLARLEFTDQRHLTIHLDLADEVELTSGDPAVALVKLLTSRERAVIALIAAGQETREIADALCVSPATVRSHVRNAMTKLGAHTRAQLVAVTMAHGERVEIPRTDHGH
jgi:DNA-binding NarL/FixJ family response regulator